MTFFDPKVLHSWIPAQPTAITSFFDALNSSLPSFNNSYSDQQMVNNYLSLIEGASSPKMSSALRQWIKQTLQATATGNATEEIKLRLDPKTLSDTLGDTNAELVLSRGYQLALSLAKQHQTSLKPQDNPFFSVLTKIREQNQSTVTSDDLKKLTFNPHAVSKAFHDQLIQTERHQFIQKVVLATAGALIGIGSLWYLYNYAMADAQNEIVNSESNEFVNTIKNETATSVPEVVKEAAETVHSAVTSKLDIRGTISRALDVLKKESQETSTQNTTTTDSLSNFLNTQSEDASLTQTTTEATEYTWWNPSTIAMIGIPTTLITLGGLAVWRYTRGIQEDVKSENSSSEGKKKRRRSKGKGITTQTPVSNKSKTKEPVSDTPTDKPAQQQVKKTDTPVKKKGSSLPTPTQNKPSSSIEEVEESDTKSNGSTPGQVSQQVTSETDKSSPKSAKKTRTLPEDSSSPTPQQDNPSLIKNEEESDTKLNGSTPVQVPQQATSETDKSSPQPVEKTDTPVRLPEGSSPTPQQDPSLIKRGEEPAAQEQPVSETPQNGAKIHFTSNRPSRSSLHIDDQKDQASITETHEEIDSWSDQDEDDEVDTEMPSNIDPSARKKFNAKSITPNVSSRLKKPKTFSMEDQDDSGLEIQSTTSQYSSEIQEEIVPLKAMGEVSSNTASMVPLTSVGFKQVNLQKEAIQSTWQQSTVAWNDLNRKTQYLHNLHDFFLRPDLKKYYFFDIPKRDKDIQKYQKEGQEFASKVQAGGGLGTVLAALNKSNIAESRRGITQYFIDTIKSMGVLTEKLRDQLITLGKSQISKETLRVPISMLSYDQKINLVQILHILRDANKKKIDQTIQFASYVITGLKDKKDNKEIEQVFKYLIEVKDLPDYLPAPSACFKLILDFAEKELWMARFERYFQNEANLIEKGIFRLSGSKESQNQLVNGILNKDLLLKQQFEKPQTQSTISYTNNQVFVYTEKEATVSPVTYTYRRDDIASVFKELIGALTIFPTEQECREFLKIGELIQKDNDKEAVEKFKEFVGKLPNPKYPHANPEFLKRLVILMLETAKHSDSNEMKHSNLAIVFSPRLLVTMPTETDLNEAGRNTQNANKAFTFMLDHAEEIFDLKNSTVSAKSNANDLMTTT